VLSIGEVRVVAGQQWGALTDSAKAQVVSAAFRITPNSDRMGYRLAGPKLELREPIEMISEGVTFGTIQLPPDGNPIVLMADRQTTGGYPKIANVASVDLPSLAQMMPATMRGWFTRQRKPKLQELATFTQQLSNLLRSGMPLTVALNSMTHLGSKGISSEVSKSLKQDVTEGKSLSDALRQTRSKPAHTRA